MLDAGNSMRYERGIERIEAGEPGIAQRNHSGEFYLETVWAKIFNPKRKHGYVEQI
jgi:hypothetical protein